MRRKLKNDDVQMTVFQNYHYFCIVLAGKNRHNFIEFEITFVFRIYMKRMKMKHTSIKVAQMRLMATLLLILGTVTAHAQYYMNIRQTDGTQLRYAVSVVDSVWFDKDEQQEPSGNYEYVDLGLSVKWATCNVGATAPEEYGDYFAWGETEPYYEAGYAQENPQAHWKNGYSAGYGWSTYKYCNGSQNAMTKYCNYKGSGYNGYTDTLTTLLPDDDAAHVNWGGNWRMPTQAELDELNNDDNCTWKWTTRNGVNGYLVTSKKSGHEGASIFLPAAGSCDYTNLCNVGLYGIYMSSSLYTSRTYDAWSLYTNSEYRSSNCYYRYYGLSVRPVRP